MFAYFSDSDTEKKALRVSHEGLDVEHRIPEHTWSESAPSAPSLPGQSCLKKVVHAGGAMASTKITILTVGSRGDLQPFLALSLGLQKAGFDVCIATNPEFGPTVRAHGVDFVDLGPNPNDAFPKLVSEAGKEFRKIYVDVYKAWMKEWMIRGCEAGKDADVIMVGPVAGVGFDVAERLKKPSVKLAYMPDMLTEEFPSPSLPVSLSLGRWYNRWTYHVIEEVSWWAARSIMTDLRRTALNLETTYHRSLEARLRKQRVPTLYAFSQSVIPRPRDWGEPVHVTGFWYLDSMGEWTPPEWLVKFLDDGAPPLYVDLGSLTVLAQEGFRNIIRGLVAGGHRVLADPHGTGLNGIALPETVRFLDDSVPHSWILPRCSGAIIHGGPGTTAAVLRAGIPVQILPVFRGHHFWGKRVQALQVGPPPIRANKISPERIASRAHLLLSDQTMRSRASAIGGKIRSEDGVANAVNVIRNLASSGWGA